MVSSNNVDVRLLLFLGKNLYYCEEVPMFIYVHSHFACFLFWLREFCSVFFLVMLDANGCDVGFRCIIDAINCNKLQDSKMSVA